MVVLDAPQVNEVPPIVVNIALSVLSAGCAFLAALYFAVRKENRAKALAAAAASVAQALRLTDLESKLALVNAAVIPISTAFQAILIKELTHFHTPEMDALMVKVGPPNILTGEEEIKLSSLLEERTNDMGPLISDSERDAALILPAVMRRAKKEQETLHTAEELKIKLISLAGVIGIPMSTEEKPQDDKP